MKIISSFFFIVVVVAISGCIRSTFTGPPPLLGRNLLKNISFEVDRAPSKEWWTFSDTTRVRLVGDGLLPGEHYALSISSSSPPSEAWTSIAAPQAEYPYRVSVYAKTTGSNGALILKVKRVGSLAERKSVVITDSSWRYYSFTDTLITFSGDSMFVFLRGGDSTSTHGIVTFDICKLEKLE